MFPFDDVIMLIDYIPSIRDAWISTFDTNVDMLFRNDYVNTMDAADAFPLAWSLDAITNHCVIMTV